MLDVFDGFKADEVDKYLLLDDVLNYLETCNPAANQGKAPILPELKSKFISRNTDHQAYREKLRSI